jgi:hypothetical protein
MKHLASYTENILKRIEKSLNDTEDTDKFRHPIPLLIGIGSIFSSIAVPEWHNNIADMVVLEGQRKQVVTPVETKPQISQSMPDVASMSLRTPRSSLSRVSISSLFDSKLHIPVAPPNLDLLSRGNAFSATSYLHAQLSFIMSLVEVGNRLISVPKEARNSSLLAEIGILNHNLPANVCIPLWCDGDNHHKILRIATTDAVVLNSAEKAPFLIYVEILNGDTPLGDIQRESKPNSNGHCTPVRSTQSMENINSSFQAPAPALTIDSRQGRRVSNTITSGQTTPIGTPETPESHHSLIGTSDLSRGIDRVAQRRISSLNSTPVTSEQIEDISEKLRTAAILLAQLYQEQQRQMSDIKTTNQQKLMTSSFEVIRNNIVKEMMQLEDQRIQFLKTLSERDVNMFEKDELLNADQEQMLRDLAVMRKSDDPSGTIYYFLNFSNRIQRNMDCQKGTIEEGITVWTFK